MLMDKIESSKMEGIQALQKGYEVCFWIPCRVFALHLFDAVSNITQIDKADQFLVKPNPNV